MLDHYQEGKGYEPLLCDDLDSGVFYSLKRAQYDMGETLKRHGSVLRMKEEEWERMEKEYL